MNTFCPPNCAECLADYAEEAGLNRDEAERMVEDNQE